LVIHDLLLPALPRTDAKEASMMTTRSAVGRRAVLGRALVVLVAAGLIACC
jgi:hypothetical protein